MSDTALDTGDTGGNRQKDPPSGSLCSSGWDRQWINKQKYRVRQQQGDKRKMKWEREYAEGFVI